MHLRERLMHLPWQSVIELGESSVRLVELVLSQLLLDVNCREKDFLARKKTTKNTYVVNSP